MFNKKIIDKLERLDSEISFLRERIAYLEDENKLKVGNIYCMKIMHQESHKTGNFTVISKKIHYGSVLYNLKDIDNNDFYNVSSFYIKSAKLCELKVKDCK